VIRNFQSARIPMAVAELASRRSLVKVAIPHRRGT
jgi:hypothetical protein